LLLKSSPDVSSAITNHWIFPAAYLINSIVFMTKTRLDNWLNFELIINPND